MKDKKEWRRILSETRRHSNLLRWEEEWDDSPPTTEVMGYHKNSIEWF